MTFETTTNGRAGTRAERLPSRRELFALAAVLAATALTAGAAIAGLTRSLGAPVASLGRPLAVDRFGAIQLRVYGYDLSRRLWPFTSRS